MHDETRGTVDHSPAKPSPARRAVLLISAGILLAGAWVLWGTSPAIPDGPVTARRSADGHETVEGAPPAAGLAAQLSALESNKSLTTGSSVSSSNGSRLMARRAALFNLSDEPLAQRVGYQLFEDLRATRRFDELRYLPHNEHLPEGERLPDLFLTLEIDALEETGIPPVRQLKAKLRLTMSDRFRRSSNSYTHTLTPPAVEFRVESDLDYSARNLGVETGAARYQAVSQDIAKEYAQVIQKQLDDLAKDHGTASTIPAEFAPAYEPAPAWNFLTELGAEKVLEGPAFMRRNVTIWQIPGGKDGATVVSRIRDGLAAAGWKTPDDSSTTYLRASDGTKTLEVFEDRQFVLMSDEAKDRPHPWWVVYSVEMTPEEITAGLKSLLGRDAPEAELLPFINAWHLDLPGIEAYFQRRPPQSPEAIAYLARRRLTEKNTEAAAKLLRRADALGRIIRQDTAPSEELKKLAKEAGLESLPKLPDLTALEPGDLIDVREGFQGPVRVRLDQTAIFLTASSDQELSFTCLTPVRRPGSTPELTYRIRNVQLGDGRSSSSDQTTGDAAGGSTTIALEPFRGGPAIRLRSNRVGESDEFELTAE